MAHDFDFFSPVDQDEALDLLKRLPDVRILAGGTDLLVLMKDRLLTPCAIVSLSEIRELAKTDLNEVGLDLGPMLPLWRLERWEEAVRIYPALIGAVRSLAAPPIRNQATLGGNLCLDTKCIYYNQSQVWVRDLRPCFKAGGEVCHVVPAGKRCVAALVTETVGPLLLYGAEVTLRSSSGVRRIPLRAFFTGDGIRPRNLNVGEMLVGIHLPRPALGSGVVYYRFAYGTALEFSQVNVTVSLRLDDEGRIHSARLIVGAIGPAPVEVREALTCLMGEVPSQGLWAKAAADVAKEAVTTSRTPRLTPYLQHVLAANTERILQRAYEQVTANIGL